jgi:hypothetical protein|tara:strand:+ start:193 stop:333 length:141 start_codon:yes stop_codon:yes gene_type:complete
MQSPQLEPLVENQAHKSSLELDRNLANGTSKQGRIRILEAIAAQSL